MAATARGRRTCPPRRCGRRARRPWGSRPGPRRARRGGCRIDRRERTAAGPAERGLLQQLFVQRTIRSARGPAGGARRTRRSRRRRRSAPAPTGSRPRWRWATSPSGGDCRTARWNSPAAAGATSRSIAQSAPADWPASVTRAGSPPNAAMLSRTHSSAAIWSSRPQFAAGASGPAARSGCAEPAEAAQPVVDAHDHGTGGQREPLAGIQTRARMPDGKAAAVKPHEHRPATIERRREHVEAQALLVGSVNLAVREHGRRPPRLWRRWPRPGGVADPGPARRRAGGA